MSGLYDQHDTEFQGRKRDIELTLGPRLQLVVFFVIVAACGLSFGLGYSMGSSHGVSSADEGQKGSIAVSGTGRQKPSATAQNLPQAPPARAVVPLPRGSGGSGAPAAPGPESADAGWQVKPALPQQQTVQGAPAMGQPQPALAQNMTQAAPGSLMVQIAAVSHQEDADVLLSALRKRGYAVNARRDLSDNLIHVRIGPFASRNEAEAMKQKLLNDGYNAQVQ